MSNQTLALGTFLGLNNSVVVGLSVVLALGVVFGLGVAVVAWALRRLDKSYTLLDLIYDDKGYPSLSKFQFLLWTLVILFFFAIVAFIRIFSGSLGAPVDIPANLIYLLGISIAVVPVASYISKDKYGESTKPNFDAQKLAYKDNKIAYLDDQIKLKDHSVSIPSVEKPTPFVPPEKPGRKNFWTILLDGDSPSLSKFQMFTWTWIAIGIFAFTFIRIIWGFASGEATEISGIILPDVSSTLVVLMGLSQGAYVGGKWSAPRTPSITTISPETGIKAGTVVAIRGVNFGNVKNPIPVGNVQVDLTDISKWVDTGIDFTVSTTVGKLKGAQVLEVVVGGTKASKEIVIG